MLRISLAKTRHKHEHTKAEAQRSHGLLEQCLVENEVGDGGGDDAEVDEQSGYVDDDVPVGG